MTGTSLEVLNTFIEEGQPPDFMALESSSLGCTQTVFTWTCGTLLKVAGDTSQDYVRTLLRFKEFWSN